MKTFLLALLSVTLLISFCIADGGGGGGDNQRTFPGRGDFRGFLTVKPRTTNEFDNIDARDYEDHEFIRELGVSKECLVKYDNIAWQVQMNGYQSRCPKAQFGALVVNFQDKSGSVKDSWGRPCGRILATSRGVKTTTDVTEHSEMDAMRRLAYHNMGQRNNASLWAPLAIFTPGASCPMDTSAERWAGVSWQLYSLSIADLIALNFTQIALEPEEIMSRSATIASQPLGLVRYVNRPANVARFAYRFIPANPCPAGCHHTSPTALCSDIEPFVYTPDMIIPDVNYYTVPDDFFLQPRTGPL